MITIELPIEHEAKLEQIARNEHRSPSEIIEQALVQYFSVHGQKTKAYELGKDLFGKYGSSQEKRSQEYKTLLKKKLHEKHAH